MFSFFLSCYFLIVKIDIIYLLPTSRNDLVSSLTIWVCRGTHTYTHTFPYSIFPIWLYLNFWLIRYSVFIALLPCKNVLPAEHLCILWLGFLPWTILHFFLKLIIALALSAWCLSLSQMHSQALLLLLSYLLDMTSHIKKPIISIFFLGYLQPGDLHSLVLVPSSCLLGPRVNYFLDPISLCSLFSFLILVW